MCHFRRQYQVRGNNEFGGLIVLWKSIILQLFADQPSKFLFLRACYCNKNNNKKPGGVLPSFPFVSIFLTLEHLCPLRTELEQQC